MSTKIKIFILYWQIFANFSKSWWFFYFFHLFLRFSTLVFFKSFLKIFMLCLIFSSNFFLIFSIFHVQISSYFFNLFIIFFQFFLMIFRFFYNFLINSFHKLFMNLIISLAFIEISSCFFQDNSHFSNQNFSLSSIKYDQILGFS